MGSRRKAPEVRRCACFPDSREPSVRIFLPTKRIMQLCRLQPRHGDGILSNEVHVVCQPGRDCQQTVVKPACKCIIYLENSLHLFYRAVIVERWFSKSQFWISSLESRSSLKRLSTKLKSSSHQQRDVCGTSFIGLQTVRIGFFSSYGGIRSRVTPSASGAQRHTTNGSASCIISMIHFHTSSTMWGRNRCRPKSPLVETPLYARSVTAHHPSARSQTAPTGCQAEM